MDAIATAVIRMAGMPRGALNGHIGVREPAAYRLGFMLLNYFRRKYFRRKPAAVAE